MQASKKEMQRMGEWLASELTGASSLTLCATFLGAKLRNPAYPHDPADFQRCYVFLEDCVHETKRAGLLSIVAGTSGKWHHLAAHWPELQALYLEERKSNDRSAPKLYKRMQELIAKAV